LESLLEEAKILEKKYEWLQATKSYQKAIELVLKEKNSLKAAELQERLGLCFFKAAMQADTNDLFRDRIELAVKAYERTLELLQGVKKNGEHIKISHVKALIAYVSAWLERDRAKKDKMLGEWWRLENDALEEYENDGDLINIGKTCNNLLQFSQEYRFWIPTGFQDVKRMLDELLNLGEKSIKILSGLGDDYELARAYCYTGLYYSVAVWWIGGIKDRVKEVKLRSIECSQKALMHSEKIADSWLSYRAHATVSMVQAIITGNSVLAAEHAKNALKHAKITKDHQALASATSLLSIGIIALSQLEEDPEKRRERFQTAIKVMQESIDHFHTISLYGHPIFQNYMQIVESLISLAQNETNIKSRTEILDKAVEVAREGIKYTEGHIERFAVNAISALSNALSHRAMVETKNSKKRRLLEESLEYCMKENEILERETPFINMYRIGNQSNQVFIYAVLAKVEQKKEKKIELLTSSLAPMENAIKLVAKDNQVHHLSWMSNLYGMFCYGFGILLNELYALTKDTKVLGKSIEVYRSAVESYTISDTRSRVAEAYWQMATVYDRLGERLESAHHYQLASENYKLAAEKISQLKEFYKEHSLYMQAWSQIEKARYSHSVEAYEEAKHNYEQAAKLHELTSSWSYLASNYLAWSHMERAEGLSRKENTQQAKQAFQKAFDYFCNAEEAFKQKLEEITSADEKEMAQKLFEASDLRRKYCQARILMEEAKLLDKEGKYLQSSRKYRKATEKISIVVDKTDIEAEKKELKYITILCQAWEKMATAEETSSHDSYLEAARLFEKAREYCYTRKASLWALGNGSFCRGLAAGVRYQISTNLSDNASAKRHIKSAASSYLQAGYKDASEYAKATLRLFDAYDFMNQAESEVNPDRKTKQYQMAENLLQLAAASFMKAKQPEKTSQVQQILKTVRGEKKLALSLNEVIHAPTITSSTSSFIAPKPTNEASVGLEKFEHANVQAHMVTAVKEVKVGESFCLSVEFINAGREPALLMRVDDFVSPDFVVVKKPEIYRIEDNTLNMKGKQLAPLKLVEVKLTLQPSKKGEYQLNPKVQYLDELGQNKSLQLKTLEIKVEEVVLEGRVSTGTQELDSLLLGGIPEEYAVVLAGPPCDEREMLVRNFLKAGAKEEVTFYVATEATGLEDMLHMPNFYLFLCNPKPKVEVPDSPNVYRLQDKTDLTNISIALTKAIRSIDQNSEKPKRICVEILSDILISHGPNITRKWISGLITNFGAKGFTMLAVMNPAMHPSDQATAVIDLFDGEINIIESSDPLDCRKSILVKKLRNQDYLKNPICLTNPK
jgi:KaiC/GvpD/RAD55 family RecA-like ATPase